MQEVHDKPFLIRFTESELGALDNLAAEWGVSRAAVLRRLLREQIERMGGKIRRVEGV